VSTSTAGIKMPGTPKPWMNATMRALLRTPGLRRLVGRTFAVITVTGSRTGKRYSTPVQAFEIDGDYLVLSQRHRTWWRNLRARPSIELLVRGETVLADASLAEGADARARLATCLERNPRVARSYGMSTTAPLATDTVDELLARVVVIVIHPSPDTAAIET
jgi:deazaflavin-dependent oxidoreductase (nitroreductase family)